MDKTIYTSGQVGLDPETGNLVSGGIGPEAEQVHLIEVITLCSDGSSISHCIGRGHQQLMRVHLQIRMGKRKSRGS